MVALALSSCGPATCSARSAHTVTGKKMVSPSTHSPASVRSQEFTANLTRATGSRYPSPGSAVRLPVISASTATYASEAKTPVPRQTGFERPVQRLKVQSRPLVAKVKSGDVIDSGYVRTDAADSGRARRVRGHDR